MDKIALITGAGSGLGRAVAIDLSNKGYKVILTSRNKQALLDTAARCGKAAEIVQADITLPEDLDRLIAAVTAGYRLDVVFFGHGSHLRGSIAGLDEQDILMMISLHLISIIQTIKRLLPLMLKTAQLRQYGQAIIFMGSVSSKMVMPNNGIYAVAKHGLRAFAMALFEELRESGIKVTTFCPGYINSREHTHANLDPDKMIQIEDVVSAIELLLQSDKACFTEIDIRPQYSPKIKSCSAS